MATQEVEVQSTETTAKLESAYEYLSSAYGVLIDSWHVDSQLSPGSCTAVRLLMEHAVDQLGEFEGEDGFSGSTDFVRRHSAIRELMELGEEETGATPSICRLAGDALEWLIAELQRQVGEQRTRA